jgi:DNA-binding NarL/FixJ family response regulator
MKSALKSDSVRSRRKIYLLEAQPSFLKGLIQILKGESNLEVCGTSGSVEQALQGIIHSKPDLVLLDFTLPGRKCLELIKQIRSLTRGVKLLIISMQEEAIYAARVLRVGGDGYILKHEDPAEIIQAIHGVLEGHIYISEEVVENRYAAAHVRPSNEKARPFGGLRDSRPPVLKLPSRQRPSIQIASKSDLSKGTTTAVRLRFRGKLDPGEAQALFGYAVCPKE